MTDGDRKSGIDIIGSVPWGTHFCQFYQTREDLIEILVPYFKAGLENNEFCMWVTSEPLRIGGAKVALGKEVRNLDDYIKKGQIEFFSHDEWYLKDGVFDLRRVLDAWVDRLNTGLSKGYEGMRVTGNTAWLEKNDWRSFAEYEEEINRVIGNYHMMALCTYSLDCCGAAEVIDVVSNHQFALIRREGKWVAIERAEQARAEAALREERNRAQNYLDIAGVIIVAIDSAGKVTLINRKGCQVLGYGGEEVIGKNWFDNFVPARIKSELLDVSEKLLSGEMELAEFYENPVLTRSGEERLIAWHSTVLRDERGNIIGHLSSGEDITERKRAEQALSESESRYRSLVHLGAEVGEAIVTLQDEASKEGIQVFCNETWPRITGYSEKELLNTSFFDLVHPGDRKDSLARHRKKMSGKTMPGLFEVTIIRKDGTEVPVEITSAYTTYRGKPANVAYIRDISERKRQEKAREFTRRLLEIANLGRQLEPTLKEFVRAIREYTGCEAGGIRVLDSEGNIPYQAYEGFSREFYDSESPLSIKSDQCMCVNVIKGELKPDLPFCTEDGSFYTNSTTDLLATIPEEENLVMRNVCHEHGYESVALVPIRLGDSILGLIHIADRGTDMVSLDLVNSLEDVVPQVGLSIRRLWAEQELAGEKGRLEVTLRSTGDGIIATDMAGTVVLLNRAAEQLTGWTQKEAVGRPIREVFYIIDERNRQPIPDPIDNVLKTGRVIGLVNHAVLISRDGTERVIADSGAPIHDDQGRIFGAVLVFRDITESRRLEEEQLRVAKLESIGVLAGGIAHDFNNLLTAIIGNIGLAMRYVEPQGKAAERLDEAEKASARARDLTQQLLIFSKGGAPVKKAAAISELIKETATFVLSGSDVRLELSLPEDLWVVEVDEGQMSQVIQNIVINADEAMPSGGTLNISAVNMAIQRLGALPLPKGNYVRIDIKDEGIGMSTRQLARIFEPYYTTKQKGSGLGLATAYSIIANHGGYITAESSQNVGSTFHIYLPASSQPKPVKKKPGREQPVYGKGRILVMDDEEIIREMLVKILTLSGHEVEVTKDGTEAVEVYRQARESGQPFDAVILDLTVPGGMGGKKTIKKLLEIDPKVKAIVSSGYATDPIMSEYKKYGFSAVVTKPYNVSKMEETLHDVLA